MEILFVVIGLACILISFLFDGTTRFIWGVVGIIILLYAVVSPAFVPPEDELAHEKKPTHILGKPIEDFRKK